MCPYALQPLAAIRRSHRSHKQIFVCHNRRITCFTKKLSSPSRPRSRWVACQWRPMRWLPAIRAAVMVVAAEQPLPDMGADTRWPAPPVAETDRLVTPVAHVDRLATPAAVVSFDPAAALTMAAAVITAAARSTTAATAIMDAPATAFPLSAP